MASAYACNEAVVVGVIVVVTRKDDQAPDNGARKEQRSTNASNADIVQAVLVAGDLVLFRSRIGGELMPTRSQRQQTRGYENYLPLSKSTTLTAACSRIITYRMERTVDQEHKPHGFGSVDGSKDIVQHGCLLIA